MRFLNRSRLLLILSIALLLLFALLSGSAVLTKSPTMDESLHAVGAYARTFAGDYHINPEDPPLAMYWAMIPHRAADLPFNPTHPDYSASFNNIERQLWFCAESLYRNPPTDGVRFINRSRLAMLGLAVLLGAVVMLWSWKIAGPAACAFAAILFCLDPNFLAHGPLIKNDVAISLVMLALAYAIYRLGERITLPRLLAVIVLCAMGPVVKFSGILLLPLLATLLLIRALLPTAWKLFNREMASRARRIGIAALICIATAALTFVTIWAAYGFRYAPTSDPSRHINFQTQATNASVNHYFATRGQWPSAAPESLPRPAPVRAVLWMNEHRLLPESWLFGFLYTYQSSLVRNSFLLGEIRSTGWWYYFPLAMLFKTPLATITSIAAACAFAAFLLLRRRTSSLASAWTLACILVPIALYGATALTTNLNLGIRHVLPIYPFLYLLTALVFARLLQLRPRATTFVATGLAVLLAAETLTAWPNYIPFFNRAAGGPLHGVALLGDSNLDWGQDLPALAQWQRAHPETKLYLCYFGTADPAYYGIRYTNLPSGYFIGPRPELPSSPGVIAVSASKLQGLNVYPNVLEFYEGLRQFPPREVLPGGTIYLFDFPPRQRR